MAPILILLTSIVLFRTVPWLAGDEALRQQFAGWTPLMGFALCGGAFLPRKTALWLPAAAILVSSAVVNTIAGFSAVNAFSIVIAVSAVAIAAAGAALKKKVTLAALLGTSILGTVLFHLASNTVSFYWDLGYAKTLGGWWQCQTTGLPQYPPTWLFSLRQLTGDLCFTAAFFACCRNSLPSRGITSARVISAA